MADQEQLTILDDGVETWNRWRQANPGVAPDLAGANLSRRQLAKADFSRAHLLGASFAGANLAEASFWQANLASAQLNGAILAGANLRFANLFRSMLWEADLQGACLAQAHLGKTQFVGAKLGQADLEGAVLSDTILNDADITGCKIYGVSVWNVHTIGTTQKDLLIVHHDTERRTTQTLTVDSLYLAQFLWLMIDNAQLRHVIDALTSKVVLILGRFTAERKPALDALREALRQRDYVPVLFDFAVPESRDITQTVALLARMARFVVADITEARSIPQELSLIVPTLPSVPVQPLLLAGQDEYAMFDFFRNFPWVLPLHRYASPTQLIGELQERVIGPAELKIADLRKGAAGHSGAAS